MILRKNGIAVGGMKMNWKGHIVITIQGSEFILRSIGFMGRRYRIEDIGGSVLFHLRSKFNWRKMNYDHEIQDPTSSIDALLVLLSIYAANQYIPAMTSA